MSPNAAAVDDRTGLVDSHAKRFEDAREVTTLRPIVEAIVDALPRPESLGQVTPRNAGFSSVQNGIDELSIAELRLRAIALLRQNRPQPLPLLIGQRMSVHPDF